MMQGTVRWGRIDEVYVRGGFPVADVVDRWGGVYRGVRFLGLGGGKGNATTSGGKGYPPGDPASLATDGDAAEVALIFPDSKPGKRVQPWILAGQMHPTDAAKVTVETAAPSRYPSAMPMTMPKVAASAARIISTRR